MEWWEEAFIGLGNGIQDFGNGVKKGVETVVRPDGRIEYVARGYISDKEGAFHITTKGNRIIHRSFFEVKEWNKFIKNKDLPSFDQLPHLKKGE